MSSKFRSHLHRFPPPFPLSNMQGSTTLITSTAEAVTSPATSSLKFFLIRTVPTSILTISNPTVFVICYIVLHQSNQLPSRTPIFCSLGSSKSNLSNKVFKYGLCTAAFFLGFMVIGQLLTIQGGSISKWGVFASGILSAICLSLMGIYDIGRYPRMHMIATGGFMTGSTSFMMFWNFGEWDLAMMKESVRSTISLFRWILLIYIFIGNVVVFGLLVIKKSFMKYISRKTAISFAAVIQYTCILSFSLYIGLFLVASEENI